VLDGPRLRGGAAFTIALAPSTCPAAGRKRQHGGYQEHKGQKLLDPDQLIPTSKRCILTIHVAIDNHYQYRGQR
jgi:hypothetical protein